MLSGGLSRGVQEPVVWDAFEFVSADWVEGDAAAGDEVFHGPGDEYLGWTARPMMRAPMLTAMPPILPSMTSHSPVWTPARMSWRTWSRIW